MRKLSKVVVAVFVLVGALLVGTGSAQAAGPVQIYADCVSSGPFNHIDVFRVVAVAQVPAGRTLTLSWSNVQSVWSTSATTDSSSLTGGSSSTPSVTLRFIAAVPANTVITVKPGGTATTGPGQKAYQTLAGQGGSATAQVNHCLSP